MKRQHLTNHIMMIRPANFGFNPETAESNAFQTKKTDLSTSEIAKIAINEFDDFVKKLRAEGVQVHVFEDTRTPVKPDCVFPNNWVSFHQNGAIITYPMLSNLRRLERRDDILESLTEKFDVSQVVHFQHFESQNQILEGTGSIVLDRFHKVAYACLSPRTDEGLFDLFCTKTGYKKMAFTSVDQHGQQIYHTNVMMAMGEDFVVICLDSIPDKKERKAVVDSFKKAGKKIVEISFEQMNAFAGNMLQILGANKQPILVMSTQAFESLSEEQITLLEKYTPLLHSSINTIEKFGGGSARCMMAEVFLPEKN